VNLVAVYGMMNRPEKAAAHYQAALRLGADAKLHLNMGTIHLVAGDLDEASQAYNQALAADGALVKAHLGLARIAFRREDYKRSENAVRQALALDPLNPISYWELGRVLRVEGKSDEAARALEQGISYSEGRTAVRLLRSLAHLYEDKGNQAAAMNALQRARTEAERSESNVDLALIDAQLGGYEGIGEVSEEP
jgi:tetratricopeptide (TPR) repeat protein